MSISKILQNAVVTWALTLGGLGASACGDGATGIQEPSASDAGDASLNEDGDASADSGLSGASDAGGGQDAGASTGAAFGAVCTADAECAGGRCFTFGQLGQRCTTACVSNSECPAGAEGQKCNMQGVCRP